MPVDDSVLRVVFEGEGGAGGAQSQGNAAGQSLGVGHSEPPDIGTLFQNAMKQQTEAITKALQRQSSTTATSGQAAAGAAGGTSTPSTAMAALRITTEALNRGLKEMAAIINLNTQMMQAEINARARAIAGQDPVAIRLEKRRTEIDVNKKILSGIPLIGDGVSNFYEAAATRGTLADDQFVKFSAALRGRTAELSRFGGPIAGALANQRAQQISRDIAESQALGGTLARLTDTETEYRRNQQALQAIERDKAARETQKQMLKETQEQRKQLEQILKGNDENAKRIARAILKGSESPISRFLGGMNMPADPNAAIDQVANNANMGPVQGPLILGEVK